MNIIVDLTFEKLVLASIVVLLASIAATEKNRVSIKALACFTQVMILIWLIIK